MGTVEPAHDVYTHATRRLVELDGVPPALVHRPPVFSHEPGITKALQEGWAVLQHRGHGEETVEPVAELPWEGLTDPVGRVPGPPVVAVRPVLQCTETHNTSVQPGTGNIRDTLHEGTTLRAGNLDGVNVGAVWGVSLKRLPALDRPRCEFVLITHDFIVAARRAFPEGQGKTPVALFADHPIVHIAQPVDLAFETKGRNPANLPGELHNGVAQLIHTDEPLVHQTKDEFNATPPARGIAVRIRFHMVQQPLLPEFCADGFW